MGAGRSVRSREYHPSQELASIGSSLPGAKSSTSAPNPTVLGSPSGGPAAGGLAEAGGLRKERRSLCHVDVAHNSEDSAQRRASGWSRNSKTATPDESFVVVVDESRALTYSTAMLHILKGNMGPGLLALPLHFAQVGIYTGLAILSATVAQGVYGMLLLVKVRQLAERSEGARNLELPLSFEDVGQAVLGDRGRRLVQGSVVVLQLGVCAVFISLCATNLQAALPQLARTSAVLVIGSMCAALALLPNLNSMWPLSLFGNFAMLTAVCSTVVAACTQLREEPSLVRAVPTASGHSCMSFMAGSFYAFEGIGLVLPIGGAMRPDKAANYSLVLGTGMAAVSVSFAVVGGLGGMAFPDMDTASITAYLERVYRGREPSEFIFTGVNVLVSCAVLATFPLQLTPAALVIDANFELTGRLARALTRLLAVGGCVALVIVLPTLDILINLIGSAANTLLAAMPFLLHIQLAKEGLVENSALTYFQLGLNVLALFYIAAVAILGVSEAGSQLLHAQRDARDLAL